MSNKCVDHICQLMRRLRVENFPSSFSAINHLLLPDSSTPYFVNCVNICPVCCLKSASSSHCDNTDCGQSRSYSHPPIQSMIIPILSQLRDILARTSSLTFEHQHRTASSPDDVIRDIYHGEVYRKIAADEPGKFLTLIMNIDGVQISKSSSSSLWIVTFAINEIHRNERFKMKNIIVGGVLSTSSKPSRDQIRVFLEPIVKELRQLERGESYEVKHMWSDQLLFLKTFLIASCCDKPAQSLVQGISEPTGAYGCGRCEIQGLSFSISDRSCQCVLCLLRQE